MTIILIKEVKIIDFEMQDEDLNVPAFSNALYKLYLAKGLDFEIDSIEKNMIYLSELYPAVPKNERDDMMQILMIQMLSKFVHYAENTAAICLAFLTTYKDVREEISGITNKLITYNNGQITDFYTNISKRDISYIAKFMGYPPLRLQESFTKGVFENSCNNIKTLLTDIGKEYLDLYEFYNAYKHGYRVLKGTITKAGIPAYKVIGYIDYNNKTKYIELENNTTKKIRTLALYCSNIIENIFENHYQRIKHEFNGSNASQINLRTMVKKDIYSEKKNIAVLYPSRGKKLEEEEKENEEIYNTFINKDSKENIGKIVAIDIDQKIVIDQDYDIEKITNSIRDYTGSGRLYIRRIGPHKGIGKLE